MSDMDSRVEVLKKYMSEEGLSQKELSERLEITRQYLNLILNSNKPITPSIALKLETLTKYRAGFWLGDVSFKAPDFAEEWKKLGGRQLVDHEIEAAVDAAYLKIKPFELKNLEPASYCLTVGNKLLLGHDPDEIPLGPGETIKLQEGNKAAILTKETVELPPNIIGKIYPTSQLLDSVLEMNTGKIVHPGYRGRLYYIIRNGFHRPIEIKAGMELLRIEFSFLPVRPRKLYEGTKQDLDDFPDNLKKLFFEPEERVHSENKESQPDSMNTNMENIQRMFKEILIRLR